MSEVNTTPFSQGLPCDPEVAESVIRPNDDYFAARVVQAVEEVFGPDHDISPRRLAELSIIAALRALRLGDGHPGDIGAEVHSGDNSRGSMNAMIDGAILGKYHEVDWDVDEVELVEVISD